MQRRWHRWALLGGAALFFCLLCACNRDARWVRQEMRAFLNTEIRLPEVLVPVDLPEGVSLSGLLEADCKVISYLDPGGCSECGFRRLLPLDGWAGRFQGEKISVLAIVNSSDIYAIRDLKELTGLEMVVLMDAEERFKTLNPALPETPGLRTFLVRDGRVLLCGSPLLSPDLSRLYRREIERDRNGE